MGHTASHAHAYHAEQIGLLEQPHDAKTEKSSRQRVEGSENPAEKQAGNENAQGIDGKGISEVHLVEGDDDHQVGDAQFDAGNSCVERDDRFYIGEYQRQAGKHG